MTDLETLAAMLDRAKIPYEATVQQLTITSEGDAELIAGYYQDSYTAFNFDGDGQLTSVEVWE